MSSSSSSSSSFTPNTTGSSGGSGDSRKRVAEIQLDKQNNDTSDQIEEDLENENENEKQELDSLMYEDPFPDDPEQEEIIMNEDDEGDLTGGESEGEGDSKKPLYAEDIMLIPEEKQKKPPKQVWRPGLRPLATDEQLDYEADAYDMMFSLNVEWPCLSFDILRDKLGQQRAKFPHTLYFVAGSQADVANNNHILLLKVSQLHKTKHDQDEDSAGESDEDEENEHLDEDPIIESRSIKHKGSVNRIRSMPQKSHIVSSWSETGEVNIWNLQAHIKALDEPPKKIPGNVVPITHKFSKEGFAMDWSPVVEGRLAVGDCAKQIHVWNPAAGGKFELDKTPYLGHNDSVEDIQWSPTEANVFASCSVDKTVKIWDTRSKKASALTVNAHDSDVNVISWNRMVSYLLVSGSDDGSFKIWDLRNLKTNTPAAHFKWHNGPITSVEWNPNDESVLSVSSSDNQITLWDLSVEKDMDEESNGKDVDLPPQLLFIHQGQEDVKEVHWHPQVPGVMLSTAATGFHIFKTINS